jgi:hypothetical protein
MFVYDAYMPDTSFGNGAMAINLHIKLHTSGARCHFSLYPHLMAA